MTCVAFVVCNITVIIITYKDCYNGDVKTKKKSGYDNENHANDSTTIQSIESHVTMSLIHLRRGLSSI